MTNPWDHLTEKEAQERRLALLYWQIQQDRNDRKMLLFGNHDPEASIRRRSKRRLIKRSGWVVLAVTALLLARYWYLNYGWNLF